MHYGHSLSGPGPHCNVVILSSESGFQLLQNDVFRPLIKCDHRITNQLVLIDSSDAAFVAADHGYDYQDVKSKAKLGNTDALKTYFSMSVWFDAASAEDYSSDLLAVVTALGDEVCANAIQSASAQVKDRVTMCLEYELPAENEDSGRIELARCFPKLQSACSK